MADNDSIQVVSRDDSENAVANPIFVQLSDGTAVLQSTGGALHVDIQDATIAVTQSGTWVLGANDGVDIGDVTVNNGAGAAAVNIQDGGNTITVDGTVAATQSGTWVLGANDGVDIGDVTINNASIAVTASDLDIRDIVATQDSILIYANTAKDGSGTNYVPLVDADGHLQVDVLSSPAIDFDDASGTRVHDYQTNAAVAAAASVNHDYTSTTANGFKLKQIIFASSGASKIEVEIGQAGSGSAKFVGFIPSEGGVKSLPLEVGLIVANTEEVRIVHTNRNKTKAQDLYSTIIGDQLA